MALTITAVAANSPNQPRIETSGTVTRVQSYVTTASLSATGVIIFTSIPIPHGAVITGAKLGAGMDTTSTTSISNNFALGLKYNGSTDYTKALGSATYSGAWKTAQVLDLLAPTGSAPWPVVVSVSDDYSPRYVFPMLTVDAWSIGSTSGSTTVRFSVAITYTMDK
jgi:hypothetical protein